MEDEHEVLIARQYTIDSVFYTTGGKLRLEPI